MAGRVGGTFQRTTPSPEPHRMGLAPLRYWQASRTGTERNSTISRILQERLPIGTQDLLDEFVVEPWKRSGDWGDP